MLQQKFRLGKDHEAFSNAYSTPFFTAKFAKTPHPFSRFGFVASKRVDKHAVVRNRAKRLLRSCVEELLPKMQGSYDVLFILNAQAVGKDRKHLFLSVVTFFKKTKILVE